MICPGRSSEKLTQRTVRMSPGHTDGSMLVPVALRRTSPNLRTTSTASLDFSASRAAAGGSGFTVSSDPYRIAGFLHPNTESATKGSGFNITHFAEPRPEGAVSPRSSLHTDSPL